MGTARLASTHLTHADGDVTGRDPGFYRGGLMAMKSDIKYSNRSKSSHVLAGLIVLAWDIGEPHQAAVDGEPHGDPFEDVV